MSEGEYNQAMLERMQQLEEAIERAEAGCASVDDWKIIRFECGISTNMKYRHLGAKNDFDSISNIGW
jgi:hypothetical protein